MFRTDPDIHFWVHLSVHVGRTLQHQIASAWLITLSKVRVHWSLFYLCQQFHQPIICVILNCKDVNIDVFRAFDFVIKHLFLYLLYDVVFTIIISNIFFNHSPFVLLIFYVGSVKPMQQCMGDVQRP